MSVTEVRLDAERAESEGRIAIGRLSQARTARAGAEAEHRKLQEAERSAVDWTERKAARRALGDLEATLAVLRREEETAEEELLAAVVPQAGLEPALDPEPVAQIVPRAGAASDSTPAADSQSSSPATPVDAPAGIIEPATPEVPVEPPPECGEAISDAGASGSLQGDAAAPVVAAESAVSPVDVTDPVRGLDPRFNAQAGSICAPIWQALRTGNVALAHHAATAINAIDPDVTLPSPALLAAVALGRRLQSPGGPIAEALRQKFAEIDRNEFETGPELWQLANNLLLLAACLRPLILAPDTGASAIAQYVHLGAGLEPLFEVQRLLGEYGQRMKGNRLDAAALGAIRSRAAWDAEFGQLQRDIDDWLDRARRFTVKFRAALDVWRCWINQDGAIGRLTGFLQSSSASAMPEVLELCETLRGTASFRALVDETDRRQLKRNRGEDIHAAAFEQLRQKAAEAVILGERWMSLMEAQPSQGDYLSRQLSELQGHLAKAGKEAMEVLKPSVGEDPWGQLTAARLTLQETLAGLLELFTGTRTPIAPEPKPEIVLGESLLRTGRVSLDAEWRPEGTPEIVLDAAKSFLVKPDTTREALDSYIACGDLDNARRLLDLMDGDAENREELTRIFERETVRKHDEFRAESRKVEEELSLALAYSLIGEKDRVDLAWTRRWTRVRSCSEPAFRPVPAGAGGHPVADCRASCRAGRRADHATRATVGAAP